jgi:DNA-binding MarR family transcriptional regulator
MIESLADSSFGPNSPPREEPTDVALEVSEEAVTAVIQAWRERACYLPSELLSDPAWSMLLELLHAELQDRKVSLSRLCTVSAVSVSGAMRWVKALESRDLVLRRSDSNGNEFVELSPAGTSALRRYFREVVQSG